MFNPLPPIIVAAASWYLYWAQVFQSPFEYGLKESFSWLNGLIQSNVSGINV